VILFSCSIMAYHCSVQVDASPSLLDVSEMYRPEERFKEKAAFRDYTKVDMSTDYTDKKENEIFLIYKKIQIGSVAK
jgi:hypothetical protein